MAATCRVCRRAGRRAYAHTRRGIIRHFIMANFDNSGSGPLAMASAKGTVKWFNSTKGYGFITLENGSDAFCHASALAAAGHADVPQGSTVVCDLQDSPRGLQVVAVHNVDTTTADPSAPRGGGGR